MSNSPKWLNYLSKSSVIDAYGYNLCGYLIALEGWRRGLNLNWYSGDTKFENVKTVGKNFIGRKFSLSYKGKTHYFFRSRGDKTTNEAVDICKDKELTKKKMHTAGVPIPRGREFKNQVSIEQLAEFANEIGYPVVLKPTKGSLGKGVYTDIQNEEELKNSLVDFKKSFTKSNIILESHIYGNEYRVYVVGERVIGATNRIPANVVGDGINTLETLIREKNQEKKKNPYLMSKSISIDYEVKKQIKEAGYTLNSVPEKGKRVFLRTKSNLSAGGDPIDATDELSQDVKEIAVRALNAVPGLGHGGIDIVVDPIDPKKGIIIELNGTAEIGFHLFPMEGQARDVAKAIVDYYFPETANNQRSNLYFDYRQIYKTLKTKSVDKIEMKQIKSIDFFASQYNIEIEGDRSKFIKRIKEVADFYNLSGSVREVRGKLRIIATGLKENKELFEEKLYIEHSKYTIINVKSSEYKSPIKQGFRKPSYQKNGIEKPDNKGGNLKEKNSKNLNSNQSNQVESESKSNGFLKRIFNSKG